MDKPVYPVINADKKAEACDIFYLSLYDGPDRILFANSIPRIGFNLLHAQRNLFFECRK